jgi:hypothetical protein
MKYVIKIVAFRACCWRAVASSAGGDAAVSKSP